MIRYLGEKQIELPSPKNTKKGLNLNNSTQIRPQLAANPQEYHSSSLTLRQLKRHNDQTALLKGRLSMLQIQEEKNDFRAFMNQQKYKFHEEMRYEAEREKLRKSRHLKKVRDQINLSHQQAVYSRKQHDYNLRKAQYQLLNSKKSGYSSTKLQERILEQHLQQMKEEQNQHKSSINHKIREYEKSQRSNVKSFLEQKRKDIHRNESEQSGKFSRVKEERKRQIEELGRLEAMMLERQARSKMISQESDLKLKKLLKHPVSTSHTTKLPSISPEKPHKDSEFFVL